MVKHIHNSHNLYGKKDCNQTRKNDEYKIEYAKRENVQDGSSHTHTLTDDNVGNKQFANNKTYHRPRKMPRNDDDDDDFEEIIRNNINFAQQNNRTQTLTLTHTHTHEWVRHVSCEQPLGELTREGNSNEHGHRVNTTMSIDGKCFQLIKAEYCNTIRREINKTNIGPTHKV